MNNTIPTEIKTMLDKGNYEQALVLIEKNISKDKNNSNLLVLKGNVYARLENKSQALETFDMALKINVGEIGAYNGKALIHFCLKENEKGMDQVKRGIIVANFLSKFPNSSAEDISTYLEEAMKPPQKIDKSEPIKPLTSIKAPVVKKEIKLKPKVVSRFCSQCGTELRTGSNFCPKCGSKTKSK